MVKTGVWNMRPPSIKMTFWKNSWRGVLSARIRGSVPVQGTLHWKVWDLDEATYKRTHWFVLTALTQGTTGYKKYNSKDCPSCGEHTAQCLHDIFKVILMFCGQGNSWPHTLQCWLLILSFLMLISHNNCMLLPHKLCYLFPICVFLGWLSLWKC